MHEEYEAIENVEEAANNNHNIGKAFKLRSCITIIQDDSLLFVCKKLNIYKDEMEQIRREQRKHDSLTVCIIQELNDNLHVRSEEYFSVFLPEHHMHELKTEPLVILKDPICSDTFHVNRIGLILEIGSVLSHHFFKVSIINILAARWRNSHKFLRVGAL